MLITPDSLDIPAALHEVRATLIAARREVDDCAAQPTINTLFSGGELFGTGARMAGWRHGWGVEYDPKIAAVARRNGFDVLTADVSDVDYEARPAARHLHASPSCRTASRANSNGGETAEDLASGEAIERAICAHAAQGGLSFTLENVYGYRWYEAYDRICATLRACGFVFHISPKGGIKPAWRQSAPTWNDAGHFVNMADFGVPQTRERLILIATRADWRPRPPGLRPTHGERGGVMLAKWRGWWSAVEDIAHEFPETKPAAWQEKRLPAELRESLLVRRHGAFNLDRDGLQQRAMHEPSWTVRASHREEESAIAYLLGGGNTNLDDPTSHARPGDAPAFTLRDGRNGSPERALLISGQLQQYSTKMDMWDGADPAPTMRTGFGEKQALRALLLGNQSAAAGEGVLRRWDDEPAMTVRAGRREHYRAHVGHWVCVTLHGLARFQTVPDDYVGLTPRINGNGVPPWFAKQLMEILL